MGNFTGVTVGNRTNYAWSCGGSAVGGACTASYIDPNLTPACNPLVTGAQPNNPSTRTPVPALCANGTATGVTTSGSTLSGTLAWSCERASVATSCNAYWNPSTQVAQCGGLVASVTGTVAPGAQVSYTCSALGYSGSTANLEYNIKCSDADTGTWGTGATRVCTAPTTNSTTANISCAVRDRTNTGVVFSGSDIGVCRLPLTTTGGGGGGGGGGSHVGKTCANGIASCATYNSIIACTQATGDASKCYSADSAGITLCQNQSLSCSGGGG